MLGNNIYDFLDQLNTEELGTFLILSSAGYQRLIQRIRKRHKLYPGYDNISSGDVMLLPEADKQLMLIDKIPVEKIQRYNFFVANKIKIDDEDWGGWLKLIKLKKDISDVLGHVPVKEDVLYRSLSGYPISRILSTYGLPIYHGPINEEGYFIRVTPWTHKKTLEVCYEFIWNQFEAAAKSAEGVGFNPIVRPERIRNPSKKVIKIFLGVEELLLAAPDDSNLIYSEEDKIKMMGIFSTIAQENKFKPITVQSSYYSILQRFQIPKFKQFEDLVVISS